ncbi:MAG: universal stress protein [Myxococcaceae bacterium]|nr:universal stress protein [Myxococcaceae bacterium]
MNGNVTSAPEEGRPVVLLRLEHAGHLVAGGWAHRFADALDAPLVLARLINQSGLRSNVLFPQENLVDGFFEVRRAERLMRARARWQDRFPEGQALLPMVSIVNLGVLHLAEALAGIRPGLVVMPASRSWPEVNVVRLATLLDVPVLVAREGPAQRRMLAASNLKDVTRPVLRLAAQWASVAGHRLTLLHNVEPILPVMVSPEGIGWGGLQQETEERLALAHTQQLEHVAHALGAEFTVTRELDTATGIIRAAASVGAGVVVVGAPSALESSRHPVAERVVAHAPQSVMVVPFTRVGWGGRPGVA